MILIVSALAACGETAVTPDTTSNTESNSAEPSETEKSSEPTTESGSETTQSGSETAEPENNVLVIYFSHTGTTKEVAAYLHGLIGGDLVDKRAESEDLEFISYYRHTRITSSYRETIYDNDLKSNRKYFPQLKT